MHVVKATCLALMFSGAAVNASRSTPSTTTGTESSLTLWEEKTDPSEHLIRPRYELIRPVGNRAWYFAAARISNIILRTVIEELERYNYISTNAHATTLNIITSVETITHIALTTASVAGATESRQPSSGRTPATSGLRGLLPLYQILLICPIGILACTNCTPIEIASTIVLSLAMNYTIGWLETRPQTSPL